MKTYKILLAAAAALSLNGCASFTSGDVLVERDTAQAMLDDSSLTPFADIKVAWKNYPYRSPTDAIAGETTVNARGEFKSQEVKPVQVTPDDLAALLKRARKIFSDAGLYDRVKGRGTLKLQLTTMNRWTYGELFKSYLVETGFIFLIPSSLRVNYLLTADFEVSTGTARVETLGQNKTTFHILLAPLYPLFRPGGKENSLLQQMLWRSATDVYTSLKRDGQAPEKKAAVQAAQPAAPAVPETTEEQTAQPAAPAAVTPAPASGQNAAPGAETPDD